MCAPATAALLLAALTALPCQGTDADDATSRVLNATLKINKTEISPSLNKIYQMLYISNIYVFNQTKLLSNFNQSNLNLIHNQNSTNYIQPTSSDTNENNNLHVNIVDKEKLPEGAKFVVNKENINTKKVKRKRSVSLERSEDNTSNTKSNNSVEVTTMVSFHSLMEKRRKPGETGSSAPLLNYIFDTYSNIHQHHSRSERPGPGNSIYAAAAPEIKALVGSTAHLDCKVDALHDKLVSWVRRKSEEEPMELLTTGTQQYTADDRYSARFIPPDIWRLEVKDVRPSDGANYDCQLSAHPPRTARVTLYVPEVSVRIVDGAGAEVSEQVCEIGSTVALRCEVRGLRMEGGPALLWYRREDLLNDDTTRGGISVRTEFGENGANSVLRVARVRLDDAGRYLCRVAHTPPVILPPAQVMLHIIKGESLAELHQGVGTITLNTGMFLISLITVFNACS